MLAGNGKAGTLASFKGTLATSLKCMYARERGKRERKEKRASERASERDHIWFTVEVTNVDAPSRTSDITTTCLASGSLGLGGVCRVCVWVSRCDERAYMLTQMKGKASQYVRLTAQVVMLMVKPVPLTQ